LTKGDDQVNVPDRRPELTAEQKTVVDEIRANRDALPGTRSTRRLQRQQRHVLGDSGGRREAHRRSFGRCKDPLRRPENRVQEIQHEDVDAINTYDDQIIVGQGFSALNAR